MKVLVVGDTGFVATYLLPALKDAFPQALLYGMSRRVGGNPGVSIHHFAGDVINEARVAEVIEEVVPDVIINLSSFSSVFESWSDPVRCHQVNYNGTLNLCLAIVKHVATARFLHISSLEVYGGSDDPSVSFSETGPINPQSPYAVSKAASELLLRQYGISHGLHYTILRPSNHTGPGRKPTYVLSSFAKQIAEIKHGLRKPILNVGNLEAHRDFLDVRDVVRAYTSVIMSDQSNQAILNVCSGHSHALSHLLDLMIDIAEVEVKIEIDSRRYRPVDVYCIKGSNFKIKSAISWVPQIPIEITLRDLLAFWEKRICQTEKTREE
jgi:GDP-4-dehydro-6-deoxy-D-mannose reductase